MFLLDSDDVFLNHGSFGACPAAVFDVYQAWQRELERQPVEFLGRRADDLLAGAGSKLAAYLNADPDELAFVTNATAGINLVARSMRLAPGDEILATDHEYGAIDTLWGYVCGKTGAHYVRLPVPLPVHTPDDMVEMLWRAVTPRTRVIFISHITSPTALRFPVEIICQRAREAGILSVIDGAHAPGQIALDLRRLGADFYAGNCHKWLCAPKGAGFLYARREHHAWLEPTIISWGFRPDSGFVTRAQSQGTRDIAAFLTVPAAIEFQERYRWDEVRARCHALARDARRELAAWSGLAPIMPDSPDWFGQMAAAPLPPCDIEQVKSRLYGDFRIEVPLIRWNEQPLIRVSFQGYNSPADLEQLLAALRAILG